MNGIENITNKIISDAREYESMVIKRTEAQIEAINAEKKEKAESAYESIMSEAKKECAAILERANSSAEVLERSILLDAKSKLLDRTFELAEQKLRSLVGEDYQSFLCTQLKIAVGSLEAPEDDGFGYEVEDANVYTVILNEKDKTELGAKLLKSVEDAVKLNGCTIRISDEALKNDGGFILRRGESEINCTLSMTLKSVRSQLEAAVYEKLFS